MSERYGVFRADPDKDRIVTTRINRAAADIIRKRLQHDDPKRLYFTSRLTSFENRKLSAGMLV